MKRTSVRFALLALALTVLSLSAFARTKSESFTISNDAMLNGTTIPAGDYVVKYDIEGSSVQVKFMQGRKEVATATGQVKALPTKVDTSQVVVDTAGNTRTISAIYFRGQDTAVTFGSADATAGK